MILCSGPDPPDLKPLIGSATLLTLLGNIPVQSHAFMIQATYPRGSERCSSTMRQSFPSVAEMLLQHLQQPSAALCPGRWLGQLNLAKIRQKEDVVKIDIPSKVKLFLY